MGLGVIMVYSRSRGSAVFCGDVWSTPLAAALLAYGLMGMENGQNRSFWVKISKCRKLIGEGVFEVGESGKRVLITFLGLKAMSEGQFIPPGSTPH